MNMPKYKGEKIISKMRKYMAIILVILIAAVGGAWYRTGSRLFVPILTYHHIDDKDNVMTVKPDDFEQQLQYLQNQGYTSITLDELAGYLRGDRQLPDKPVVITFDDGYEDNQRVAVPLLRKYGFTAIIFVVSDDVGKPGYLTWDQMKAVQERAINIGSHTMTHPDLTKLDAQGLDMEFQFSKMAMEKGLGTPIDYMAYPFGRLNKQVLAAAEAAGYKGALSSNNGVNVKGDSMYALRRIVVGPTRFGLWEFKLRLIRAQLLSVFQ